MKKILIFLLVLLFYFPSSGQIIDEFDWLISDTTLEGRITYRVSVDTKEYKSRTGIVEIDRDKYQVVEKHLFDCEKGCSWSLTEYDKDWRKIRKVSYINDSIRFSKYEYYYDTIGMLRESLRFKLDKENNDQGSLILASRTKYLYNSECIQIGLENTRYINGDTLTWRKSIERYILNRRGLVRKSLFYEAEENNSEVFMLNSVSKSRCFIFGKDRRKSVERSLERNYRRVSKYSYLGGLLSKVEIRKNGKFEYSAEYKYQNDLVTESYQILIIGDKEIEGNIVYEYF